MTNADIDRIIGEWSSQESKSLRDLCRTIATRATKVEREACACYLFDRAEQYDPSTGTRAAFDELIRDVRAGWHAECFAAGEYDDLRAARKVGELKLPPRESVYKMAMVRAAEIRARGAK
jgi:hypothetical protein